MATISRTLWTAVTVVMGLALASCGGKVNPSTVRVGGEKRTSAALAGSRCAPEGCTCRNLDAAADQAEQSPPAPGMKRFELRVGPTTQPTWVGVAGVGTLYRASDSGGGEVCFYVDLRNGQKTSVSYRGQAETQGEGVHARLAIREYSAAPKGPWWYDTFEFACGGDRPCSAAGLRDWRENASGLSGNLKDPCGSTKIRNIEYSVDRGGDEANAGQVDLRFQLDVYPFAPRFAPGAPECQNNK
ncbi:MAG: hypothetical protein IT370_23660 [Deltaproteobacteria bacterium]|nr:hypothetical protein [Deltaproteobacteria bacterium]